MPILFGYFPNESATERNLVPMPKTFNEYTGGYDSFWIKQETKGKARYKIIADEKILQQGNLHRDKDGYTVLKPARSFWLSKLFVDLINKDIKKVTIQMTLNKKNCSESMILETGD